MSYFKVMYSKIDAQSRKFAIVNDKRIVFPITNDRPSDHQSYKIITIKVAIGKEVFANGLRLPILMRSQHLHFSVIQADNKKGISFVQNDSGIKQLTCSLLLPTQKQSTKLGSLMNL